MGWELLSSWANSNKRTAKGKGIQALTEKNLRSRAGERGKKRLKENRTGKKKPRKRQYGREMHEVFRGIVR